MNALRPWKIRSLWAQGVLFFEDHFIHPYASDEVDQRREFILNVLLVASLIFTFVAFLVVTYNSLFSPYSSISPIWMAFLFMVPLCLLTLSRHGYFRLASVFLIGLYFIPATYVLYVWGADVPQGLLIYSLLIVLTGVLLGTQSSLWMTGLITATLLSITYLQVEQTIRPSLLWKQRMTTIADAITVAITLFIMALLAWLSNREIDKSLHRAQESEAALKKERDSLEIKVQERTQELKRLQLEQVANLYRFVEFGRLASGFFHDLSSPLTALSLNLERLQLHSNELGDARAHIERAFRTTKRIEDFLSSVRKQIRHEETSTEFSVIDEIQEAVHVLQYRAHMENIQIKTVMSQDARIKKDPFKFNKIILNLLANALDSYLGQAYSKERRHVDLRLTIQDNAIHCSIHDQGCGMSKQTMEKIFEPFFSTKSSSQSLGIGLPIIKEIIEQHFGGSISVESQLGVGSTFSFIIPLVFEPE